MTFSLLKQHPSKQHTPSTTLSQLKKVAISLNATLFEEINLYHHNSVITLPLFLYIPRYGIIILHTVSWYATQLSHATVSLWKPDSKHPKAIDVDTPLQSIRQKFSYMLHRDLSIATAMVLFENLRSDEFDTLDHSFASLIPKSRALFCDETAESIKEKIIDALRLYHHSIDTHTILSTLFVQYALPPTKEEKYVRMADDAQQHYINADFSPQSTLVAPFGSGKSTLMLLKILTQTLLYPKRRILIISASRLSCDLLRQQMLTIIEYGMLDVDLSSIDVLTPKELHEQHSSHNPLHPTSSHFKRLRKPIESADLVICDDVELFSVEFIYYLQHTQKKYALHLICTDPNRAVGDIDVLTHVYRTHPSLPMLCNRDLNNQDSYKTTENIKFYHGNIFMQTIIAFKEILAVKHANETALIIVPNMTIAQRVYEEMYTYIDEELLLIDTESTIDEALFHHHIITTPLATASLHKAHVIVAGISPDNRHLFCHALSRADRYIYIVVHDKNDNTVNLHHEELMWKK